MHFGAKPSAAVGRTSSRGCTGLAKARQFHASIRGGAILGRGGGSCGGDGEKKSDAGVTEKRGCVDRASTATDTSDEAGRGRPKGRSGARTIGCRPRRPLHMRRGR